MKIIKTILSLFLLSVACFAHTVGLTWNATSCTSGATLTYSMYRSTVNGSSYSPISVNISTLNYTDSLVSNGTTYYYVVTGVCTCLTTTQCPNGSGGYYATGSAESVYSNQATAAIPGGTPSAPQNLSIIIP